MTGPRGPQNQRASVASSFYRSCSAGRHSLSSHWCCQNCEQAVRRFLTEDVLDVAERDNGTFFRQQIIYKESIDAVFKSHLSTLQQVFAKYSGRENLPSEDHTMCLGEWQELLDAANPLLMKETSLGTMLLNYATSMRNRLRLTNSPKNAKNRAMNFVEFLEAIGRVAYVRQSNILDAEYNKTSAFIFQKLRL